MTPVDERERLEQLVRTHLDQVYAAALRQTCDAHMASDVTQAVFLILQRKLGAMNEQAMLGAWLLRVTHYACLDAKKIGRRRAHHEREAAAMRKEAEPAPQSDMSRIIDAAMDRLSKADREAIVLAYFESRPHDEIARMLGISIDAAHKRVQRAVERLRAKIGKKGITVGAVTAILALFGKPVAAPAAVHHAVMLSLSGHISAGVSLLTKGTMIMMKVIKAKVAAVLVLAVVGTGLLGTAAYQRAFGQVTPQDRASSEPTVGLPRAPATAPTLEFEPVVQLTLHDDTRGNDSVLDLDSGKTMGPLEMRNPFDMVGWMEKNGADVFYQSGDSGAALLGFGMTAVPRSPGMFDQPGAGLFSAEVFVCSPGTPALMSVQSLPATFYFQTREGRMGVLEIQRVGQNPDSVTFRYKLLTSAAQQKLVAQAIAELFLPEIQKQTVVYAKATGQANSVAAARDYARAVMMLSNVARGSPWSTGTRRAAAGAMLLPDCVASGNAADIKGSFDKTSFELQKMQHDVQSIVPPAER